MKCKYFKTCENYCASETCDNDSLADGYCGIYKNLEESVGRGD